MKRWLFLIFLGVTGALGFRFFLFEGIYIASPSMEPTLPTNSHYFVNKFVYKYSKPKRGDIVVFNTPQGPGKDLVKRVIAIEGDVIGIKGKKVFLNGTFIDEPYVQYVREDEVLLGDNIPPVQIPEGYVFLMGDNRDVSIDSRDFGIKEKQEWDPYVAIADLKGRLIDNR